MISKELLFSRKRKNKGFVLVSVLMLGVLLISCATAFTWFVRMQVRTIGRERLNIASRSMAHVVTNAVMTMSYQISQSIGYDSPLQRWHKPFVLSLGDELGIWVIQMTPLDDKIPLGNLFLPDGNTLRREFNDVWENMWDKLHHREYESIVLDFLDRNARPRIGSKEENYFINRGPYDISELLMLSKDIPSEIIYGSGGQMGLADYCTIYSEGRINLNVAPLHVMELLPGLDTGLASRIEQVRKEEPLEALEDVQKIPGASGRTASLLTNIAAFHSRYFMLNIQSLNGSGEGGTSFNIIFDRTTRQIVRWEEI